jgi:hypothetical protein
VPLSPSSTFTLFLTKVANRTDSNSNSKFINIRCGHFDTILRSIRYSVKFWRPLVQIGPRNLIFPKIKLANLFSLRMFFGILDQNLEENRLWSLAKEFRVLSFCFIALCRFRRKISTLPKIGQLNIQAWGWEPLDGHQIHIFEATVLASYNNLCCIY